MLEDCYLFDHIATEQVAGYLWDIASDSECMCGHSWTEHNSFITPIPCEKCHCEFFLSEVSFYGRHARIYV